MTTTTAPKYEVIDKLMVTLLSADDATAIVSARSAVKRKLDASKLDIHNLFLRPLAGNGPDRLVELIRANAEIKNHEAKIAEQAAEIERLKTHAEDPDVLAMIAAAIKVDRRNAFKEAEALEAKLKSAEDRADETRREMAIVSYRAEELTIRAESAEERAEEYRKFGDSLRALIATLGDVVA